MSLATVYTRAHIGIHAPLVRVEVHLSSGLPAINIVGLAETTVRESKDRVRSAIINSGFDFPIQRITINLAPADLPKAGGRFDLAIAMGILAASGQVPMQAVEGFEFLAELALTAELKPCQGILSAAVACQKNKRQLVVALANGDEAIMPAKARALAPNHLNELSNWLLYPEKQTWHTASQQNLPKQVSPELQDVHGQEQAKRALVIAASGGHNLVLCGPPGTGKTMLAKRLHALLPNLTEEQAMEVGAIASSAGDFDAAKWQQPPWRSPHHSASLVALVGGGGSPKAGEISRAHHGLLFLDELAEFPRQVIDSLRQPMENGHVEISRALHKVEFPARFLLVAATNPCPCGYYGDKDVECRCSPNKVANYINRISGPLLDRIDIQIAVNRPTAEQILQPQLGLSTAQAKVLVDKARSIQYARQGCLNGRLEGNQLDKATLLGKAEQALLENASQRLALSPRALHKLLRLARTIADLDAQAHINQKAILEALSYRQLHDIRG